MTSQLPPAALERLRRDGFYLPDWVKSPERALTFAGRFEALTRLGAPRTSRPEMGYGPGTKRKLADPAISSIIPGPLSRDEVTANVAALQADTPADLWAELKREGLLRAAAPAPGST